MSYQNLTNEEIVFLYYVAVSVVSQYEETFRDKSIKQSISPDGETLFQISTDLPEDLIDELLKSKHYVMMRDIRDKMHPIYILIKEVEPEIVKQIDDIFNYKPKE